MRELCHDRSVAPRRPVLPLLTPGSGLRLHLGTGSARLGADGCMHQFAGFTACFCRSACSSFTRMESATTRGYFSHMAGLGKLGRSKLLPHAVTQSIASPPQLGWRAGGFFSAADDSRNNGQRTVPSIIETVKQQSGQWLFSRDPVGSEVKFCCLHAS